MVCRMTITYQLNSPIYCVLRQMDYIPISICPGTYKQGLMMEHSGHTTIY